MVKICRKMYQDVDSGMTNVTVPSTSSITLNEMTDYTIMNLSLIHI